MASRDIERQSRIRTSLNVVRNLIPSYSRSAQLDPVVHICVQALGLAMEFEQRGYTDIALRSGLPPPSRDMSVRTIVPLFVSYS